MDLVRDVLDKQVVDRRSDRMGKVDGLVLALREGQPPRVSAIEIGPVALARRWSERAAAWLDRVLRRVVGEGPGAGSTRFDVALVSRVDLEVTLDMDADATPARRIEHWLRDHVIGPIPGSGVKG